MPSDDKASPLAGTALFSPSPANVPDRPVAGDLLENIFEQAPLGMLLFDARLQIARANAAFADMLGSTPEQLAGRPIFELIHAGDRERGREALRRVQRRELTWVTVQQRCVRDDGQIRWGEFVTRIFWDANGGFLNALAIVRDVTDSVTAEAALRESEMRNWRITESNMMGLFEWRDAVSISEANDAFLQMVGYSREDLRSGAIRWNDIVPPDAQDLVLQLRDELLTTGRIRPTHMDYVSQTGERIPVLAGGARISSAPVRGIGFVLDMSEQRRMEDERSKAEDALRRSLADLKQTQARLQLADRMASMGTLASGVAHEINNPLGFVVANLGFAQEEVTALRDAYADPDQLDRRLTILERALSDAQEGATRVRNIVRDLRTFSHPNAEMQGAVDVCRVLDSVANMAQGEIRGRARIVRRFQPVPPVLGGEARVSQLFLNLVVNAAQSIPKAEASTELGELGELGGTNGVGASGEIRLSVERTPAGAVQVEVTDTGRGIPAEHLARIFDPFYTTRPIGIGTGLGLSICHSIVESLGGEITVRSEAGAGTTFRVVLPSAPDSEIVPRAAGATSVPSPSSERARILIVDDEPLMGSAMARVLASHDVVALTSARAAMSLIAAGERFEVILCDVMMPDFSGIDLYEYIAREVPDLLKRVVFVTGGAYTPDAIDFLDRVPNVSLEKPILPQALHAAITAVLQTTGEATATASDR